MKRYSTSFFRDRPGFFLHLHCGARRIGSTGPLGRCIGCWLAFLLLACVGTACAAHDAVPAVRIPLNPLGYQNPIPEFLASGSAMATVDFADSSHLLVTFGLRGLLKRDPEDPVDDDDRLVAAVLVALPSGKVVGRTEWHLHDRGQYLWSLGDGRFLLRVRDRLSLLDPTRAAGPEDVFRERAFLQPKRPIVALSVSAEHSVITVETADPPTPAVILADGDNAGTKRAPVQINFYRVVRSADTLVPSAAGTVRSANPVSLPVNAQGFLDAFEAAHNHWLFHFNSASGTMKELAAFDTSCYPHSVFVSETEFVAIGCRGISESQNLAGFDLKGDFMWQQGFFDTHVSPSFAFAPAAGRFAMGRTIVNSSSDNSSSLTPSEVTGQEVRVYQTWSGKILFRIACTPPMRAGQNFALSEDGMHVAVLRQSLVQHKATKDEAAYSSQEAAIEIYDLPALSTQDEAAVRESRKLVSTDESTRIDLAIQRAAARIQASRIKAGATSVVVPAENASANVAASPENAPAPPAVQPAPERKPPSLYAPDERPDAAGASGRSH